MPTYEYQCKLCANVFEEFQSIAEEPLKRCPKCNTDNLARIIGMGGGLIFKGTGFYLTDYKKSRVSHDEGEKKTDKPESKGEKKTDKPESKGEKPAPAPDSSGKP